MRRTFMRWLCALLLPMALCCCAKERTAPKAASSEVPVLFAYGRSLLSEPGLAAYDAILAAARDGQPQAMLPAPLSRKAFLAARDAVLADCPTLDRLEVSAVGDPVLAFSVNRETSKSLFQQENILREASAPLLEGLPQEPVRRVSAIHDRLLEHTVYREGAALPEDGTAYGALVNGTAVCNGFSRAFQYLCQQAGIPCCFIEGTSIRGIPHSWNMVELEGEWLYVDVTWDASPHPRSYHDYFLVSLPEMAREHFPGPGAPPLPPGDAPGYYERFGYSVDTDGTGLLEAMADAFARQLLDFPPETDGKPVFLEIKLTGERFSEGRALFQASLFPLLSKINQRAVEDCFPFTVETTGPVEYQFNDATRVITLFPIAKKR